MKTIAVKTAKEKLAALVEQVVGEHDPVCIKSKDCYAVLVGQDEWRGLLETVALLSMPGLRESIQEGMETPVDECVEELDW